MPKTNKEFKEITIPKVPFSVEPWNCVKRNGKWMIEAHVEILGDWAPVAEIQQSRFIDAEKTAQSIVRIVNNYQSKKDLFIEMIEALELCLDSKGMTWEAEQAADLVLRRAKNLI